MLCFGSRVQVPEKSRGGFGSGVGRVFGPVPSRASAARAAAAAAVAGEAGGAAVSLKDATSRRQRRSLLPASPPGSVAAHSRWTVPSE